jgi:hypothetical protein
LFERRLGDAGACGARPGPTDLGERRVSLQAGNRGALVRWLQELLYSLDVFHRLPTRIEVSVSPSLLSPPAGAKAN